jgi:hypothetical protein
MNVIRKRYAKVEELCTERCSVLFLLPPGAKDGEPLSLRELECIRDLVAKAARRSWRYLEAG